MVLAIPCTAAAQDPGRTPLAWQRVAATGQPAPGGGSFGRFALAPRIADDGALWFASSAPFGSPPLYSVLRWTAEQGAEELVRVEPPPSLPAFLWTAPRLFSSPQGHVVWAEGFGPSPAACGETGTEVHQPREWLFGAPRGGDVAVVAMTGDAPVGVPESVLAQMLGPSPGLSGSVFPGPEGSGPTGGRSPDAERQDSLAVRAGGASQFGRVDFVFEGPTGSGFAGDVYAPDDPTGPGFGRRDFVTPWSPPLVALDASGRAVWLAELADQVCFNLAVQALPTRPPPTPCEDCVEPAPTDALRSAVLAQDQTGASVLVAREGDLVPGDVDGDPRISQLGFWQAMDPSGGLWVHATLGGRDSPSSVGVGQALLRWTVAGDLTVPLRSGTPSTWTGGAALASFTAPVTSPGGRVALFATRVPDESEPDLGGPMRATLWVGDAHALEEQLVFDGAVPGRAGDLVFALPFVDSVTDETLRGVDSEFLRVNDAGEVAFVRTVAAAPNGAIPAVFGPGPDGAPRLRLLVGDPAPGVPDALLTSLAVAHLSESGDLLVRAGIGPVVGLPGDVAWLRVPRVGVPQLLLRSTDLLEVAPGTTAPAGASKLTFDSALTRVALRTEVPSQDSAAEAIFVAAIPVPEPAGALGGLVAAIAVGGLARRRRFRLVRGTMRWARR